MKVPISFLPAREIAVGDVILNEDLNPVGEVVAVSAAGEFTTVRTLSESFALHSQNDYVSVLREVQP